MRMTEVSAIALQIEFSRVLKIITADLLDACGLTGAMAIFFLPIITRKFDRAVGL